MPFVLIYKVAWPTYVAARLVVNVDFLGMPNLLAGKKSFRSLSSTRQSRTLSLPLSVC